MAELASAQKAPRRKDPKELSGKPRAGLKPKRRAGWKETPTRVLRSGVSAEQAAAEAEAGADLAAEAVVSVGRAELLDVAPAGAPAAAEMPVAPAASAATAAAHHAREKDAYIGPGTKGMVVYFGILGVAGLAVIVLNLLS